MVDRCNKISVEILSNFVVSLENFHTRWAFEEWTKNKKNTNRCPNNQQKYLIKHTYTNTIHKHVLVIPTAFPPKKYLGKHNFFGPGSRPRFKVNRYIEQGVFILTAQTMPSL